MELTLTTDSGSEITITVVPGDVVWLRNEKGQTAGSLYLDEDGDTLSLGRTGGASGVGSEWDETHTVKFSEG